MQQRTVDHVPVSQILEETLPLFELVQQQTVEHISHHDWAPPVQGGIQILGTILTWNFVPSSRHPHELSPSPNAGHGSSEGRAQGTFNAELETPDQILGAISQDFMVCSRYAKSCRRSQWVS